MTEEDLLTDYWAPLAMEVFRHAKKYKSIAEYKSYIYLQPVNIGQNQYSGMKVLDFLLNNKTVFEHEDGSLRLGKEKNIKWLSSFLEEGNLNAWQLLEISYPNSNFARKFDDTNNKRVGLIGENFIVSELKRVLPNDKHKKINHTSLTNDSAGYDIKSPKLTYDDSYVHLEVKTTAKPIGKLRPFITRNEFKKSQSLQDWYVIFVRLINGLPILEGYLESNYLENIMPIDNPEELSSWSSAIICPKEEWIKPGLPIY